jgi:5'-phosphate synthase pdxT subunit
MGPIGVLALQGDFRKHLDMLASLGADARPLKDASELPGLSGVILPGGESTTIGMLMERRGLLEPLKQALAAGLPAFGTCAGAILLAKDIEDSDQLRLGVMDMSVLRNAYGSQVDSFEAKLDFSDPENGLRFELEGVFIRAPRIDRLGPEVQVLARFDGKPVLIRQGRMLAATFHPELTSSSAVHAYFLKRLCGLTGPQAA